MVSWKLRNGLLSIRPGASRNGLAIRAAKFASRFDVRGVDGPGDIRATTWWCRPPLIFLCFPRAADGCSRARSRGYRARTTKTIANATQGKGQKGTSPGIGHLTGAAAVVNNATVVADLERSVMSIAVASKDLANPEPGACGGASPTLIAPRSRRPRGSCTVRVFALDPLSANARVR